MFVYFAYIYVYALSVCRAHRGQQWASDAPAPLEEYS